MLKLLMIPITMILTALLLFWIEESRETRERNADIRWLIRKNVKWERQIEEQPHRRMQSVYATAYRRG